MTDEKRVEPIATVTPVWEANYYNYPPLIRVAMKDGTVQDYQLVIRQPEPNFREAMDALDRMVSCITVGYRAPETKRRRRL